MWKSTILSPTFFFLSVYRAYALAVSLGCTPPVFLRCLSSRALPRRAASGRHPAENPAVGRLRELFTGDTTDGWQKSWEVGVTLWDLGMPTPVIQHLVRSGTLPKGRVLVPGCGMGTTWSLWQVLNDLLLAWTFLILQLRSLWRFFCALEPNLRTAWAETVNRLLKPDGELLTLIYLISHQGGPPYNNTVADYQTVLDLLGFKAVLLEDNELAIKPRAGCEKLGRWKSCGHQSSL